MTEMLKELHWLPIRYRILYKLSFLVFKCMNNIGLAYLKELLINKKAPRTLRSAELCLLGIPRVRQARRHWGGQGGNAPQ